MCWNWFSPSILLQNIIARKPPYLIKASLRKMKANDFQFGE
jgi:hypothetical protein